MMDRRNKRKRNTHCSPIVKGALILAVLILTCAGTAGTIAYLQQHGSLENRFTSASLSASVQEEFDGRVKTNVQIQNDGDIDAYIRAKILVYYVDEKGNIVGDMPVKGTNYEMTMGDMTNFIQAEGGYYYFKKPVSGKQATDILIKECKELTKLANRTLVVDVFGEAIQAHPQAVQDAWGSHVKVNETTKELEAVKGQ